jgi:uncharacterized protein YndB with AHSA1/START domain
LKEKAMIDVIHEINAVRRQVGTRVLEAGEARTMTIARSYDAEIDDVWDACTSAERIRRWFSPVSGDLREGGRFQVEGNAGGTIQHCDAPHGFAATWEFGGEVSWIELRLSAESSNRTRLELVHTAHVSEERWAEYGPGALGVGWELSVMGLAQHLATAATMDPAEFAAWSGSEEGRQFIRLSSEAWERASTAAGTDPAMARAAARRTTAFYTGVPETSEVA